MNTEFKIVDNSIKEQRRNEERNTSYRVREWQLGLHDEFEYFQCASCECLQIAEIPADMSRYYTPSSGYFEGIQLGDILVPRWAMTMWFVPDMREWHRAMKTATGLAPSDDTFAKMLAEKAAARYLADFTARQDVRILDVGCGRGGFIYHLRENGFTNVAGVDLFIDQPVEYSNGVKVSKGTIYDVEASWDVIMMHHSFEHVPDPLETLQAIAERLSPQGVCMIRIPIASCYAWEHYRTHWIQVDAPRHFFLHSLQSLERLAKQAGLRIEQSIYDSQGTALVMSDIFQRGMFGQGSPDDLFSSAELQTFEDQAIRLNQEKRGDQAAFYLVRDR